MYISVAQILSKIYQRISKYLFSNFHAFVKFTILQYKIEMELFFPISPMLFKIQIEVQSFIYVLETYRFDHLKCYLSLGASSRIVSPIFLLILYMGQRFLKLHTVFYHFSETKVFETTNPSKANIWNSNSFAQEIYGFLDWLRSIFADSSKV